jgi:hypothetical protein
MKKKKIYLVAAAAILFAAGALADRASRRFFIDGIYFTSSGTCTEIYPFPPNINRFSTTATGGNQATMSTSSSGGKAKLYATSTCIDKLYFIP